MIIILMMITTIRMISIMLQLLLLVLAFLVPCSLFWFLSTLRYNDQAIDMQSQPAGDSATHGGSDGWRWEPDPQTVIVVGHSLWFR